MVPNVIELALLELAHLLWYIYNRITFLCICIYYHILSAYEQTNNLSDFPINYHDVLSKEFRIPRHIAMSFTNEANNLDLDSIARLLCWCKQLGIHHITLYDDLGKLERKEKDLIKSFELKLETIGFEKPISNIPGLRILSRKDGRPQFVEDVKNLLRHKPEDIDLKQVQEFVGWKSCDPELLISFGTPLCLYGFPPWQLRLTEVLSLPTHRKVPRKAFFECLRRYSRITQREGI